MAAKPGTRSLGCACTVLLLLSCGESATTPGPATPPPPPPPPLVVSIAPAERTLTAVDDTVRLTADVRDQAGQVVPGAVVRWSSSAQSVASVDASGLVTARSNGATTIRAIAGRGTAEARITVAQVRTGIAVRPSRLEFARIGETAQLTALGTDANGYDIPGAIAATWSTVDTSIATVDSTGLVTASGNGSTGVRAVVDSSGVWVSVDVVDVSVDREILERLYHATGGANWTRSENWLTDAPLARWSGVWVAPNGRVDRIDLSQAGLVGALPPELADLRNLRGLWLSSNELTGPVPPELGSLGLHENLNLERNGLTGPIPPELGELRALKELHLHTNDLSGPVPTEIGNLTRLTHLTLAFNPDLRGLLPVNLTRLTSLSRFAAWDTGLCPPVDDDFRRWMNRFENPPLRECDLDRVRSLVLSEFFDLTGGDSWVNADGWTTDSAVEDWYGLTVEDGRVRSVSLAGNGLTGSIPAAVAGLAELESLDLRDNDLAGQVPSAIGSMASLTTLRLGGNAGLEGYLPPAMTDLERLDLLEYDGTGLCMPPTRAFLAWLEGVDVVDGPLCENVSTVRLQLPMAYLTQSIQRPAGDVPLVAGRDALMRVFLTSDDPNAFFVPSVAIVLSISGEEVHRETIRAPASVVPTHVDEGNLLRSYNAVIPAEFIRPGLEFVVEVDPEGAIPLAAGIRARYPDSGVAKVDVVEVPPMELTVVPVVEAAAPDSSIYRWVNNIDEDSWQVGLLRYAFPFSEFRAGVRETYATSADLTLRDGRWRLLLELEGVYRVSGGSGYWYGVAASVNGPVRGIAKLDGRVSLGTADRAELAHEVGHNLGLLHAPCGAPLSVDPDFPYRDGGIGAWGYDFGSGRLVSAETQRDIMGYCYAQGWLSDYFFEKVIRNRAAVGADIARPAAARSELLVLWGGVVDGELRIEPSFRASATERTPAGPGPYRIEGFAGGATEFSYSFTPGEDQFGDKYFFFTVPSGPLDRITLAGPEGTATIGVDDPRTVSVVRDPSNGRIRSILDDWNGDLPEALGRAGRLDIVTWRALGNERR